MAEICELHVSLKNYFNEFFLYSSFKYKVGINSHIWEALVGHRLNVLKENLRLLK